MGKDLTGETNHDAGAEADQRLPDTAEEADEPDDDSRLPTSYCKDGPAVEIGGCRAIVLMPASGRGYHDLGRAQLAYRCDPV